MYEAEAPMNMKTSVNPRTNMVEANRIRLRRSEVWLLSSSSENPEIKER